jgi:hypothetical protein
MRVYFLHEKIGENKAKKIIRRDSLRLLTDKSHFEEQLSRYCCLGLGERALARLL